MKIRKPLNLRGELPPRHSRPERRRFLLLAKSSASNRSLAALFSATVSSTRNSHPLKLIRNPPK
jgi:hypothetical protein